MESSIESKTKTPPSSAHEKVQEPVRGYRHPQYTVVEPVIGPQKPEDQDQNQSQDDWSAADMVPTDTVNNEEFEMVFRMDIEAVEGLLTLVPQCMATTNESNKEPKPRIAVAIAALIHNEKHLEHMKKYYGLLVYNDRGITTDKTEEPLVGWIIAETPWAMDGGEYMVLLIYKKEINMVMIDHVLGNQIIDTIQAAGTVDMIDKENDYGDRVYEMVHQLAST